MWCGFGLEPDDFWSRSPREVALIIDAYARRDVALHNELAWHAWHVAALQRKERLTPLNRLTIKGPTRPARRQTWQEQMAVMERIAKLANKE